jgi:uncharacterized protein (DUF2147 family)
MTIATKMAALASAALMTMVPAASFAESTIGVFQTTDRKMDYLAEMCGKNDRQLCVTLTAARGSANNPKTQKYIGKLVIDHAKPTGQNVWHGKAYVQGYTAYGDIVLVPGQTLTIKGCVMMVVCGDFMLIPAM